MEQSLYEANILLAIQELHSFYGT